MASVPEPSMKRKRSVSLPDNDIDSSPAASDAPSQSKDVDLFQQELDEGYFSTCISKLKNHQSLTWSGSPLEWLKEPLAMGFTPEEIVILLFEQKMHNPWIPRNLASLECDDMIRMDPSFHQVRCVHQPSGLRYEHQLPQPLRTLPIEAKRKISDFCGIGGIIPFLGQHLRMDRGSRFGVMTPLSYPDPSLHEYVQVEDSTASVSYRDPGALSNSEVFQRALGRCQLVLQRISNLCAWLQNNDWLCDRIIVIRYDGELQSAAIPLFRIAQLQERVDVIIEQPAPPQDHHVLYLFETAIDLLWMELPDDLSTGYELENAVDLCALAVQMISVSLLSLCEAHVGPIHSFFLDRPMTKICLSGINGPMSKEHRFEFNLGGLACLGLMLGSPVMVITSGLPADLQEDSRLSIDTSIEHLFELWGPGRLITNLSLTAPYVQAIEIGAGTIYQPSEKTATLGHLHWAPGQSVDNEILGRSFSITDRQKIVGLVSINQNCPSRLHNEFIPTKAIRQEVHELGTWSESWKLQQIQAGFQAGQVANVNLNATWIKSASRTKKEKALTGIGSDLLDQTWGLLVSLCTGIARRVPLHVVIAEVFPHMISAWLEDPDMSPTSSTHDLLEKLRQPSFGKWLSSQPSYDRKLISLRIKYILQKLCWTGVSSKPKLVTACTSERQTDGCIHISLDDCPVLATLLKDTERSATFASLTTECVVTDNLKCPSNLPPRWNNRITALATSVCQYQYTGKGNWAKVTNNGLQHGRLYWMGHMKENRRLVAEVLGTQGNKVVLKVADSQVLWLFYARAYERLERMRDHYIALREQSYVGEDGAEEVIIVSG